SGSGGGSDCGARGRDVARVRRQLCGLRRTKESAFAETGGTTASGRTAESCTTPKAAGVGANLCVCPIRSRFNQRLNRDLTLFLWQRERRDGFVYLIHNAICFCQRDDDSLIVHHVLNGEIASAPIFEPLFQHLIAADVEVPQFRCDAFKILFLINVYPSLRFSGGFSVFGIPVCNQIVTISMEACDQSDC